MTIIKTNATVYADMFALVNNDGKTIGTCELKVAGREAGKRYYSSWSKYTKKEIKALFEKARNSNI